MKLSQWAKNKNLSYQTAWNLFKSGKLPVKSTQLKTGTILVEDEFKLNKEERCVTYSRVSNHSRKDELNLQVDRCLDVIKKEREFGSKIVFTNGCFDILHAGHVEYLAQAKSFGDFLVVGLNSDASVRRLKGSSRPIQSEINRAIVLAGLSSVDAVVIFNDDTPQKLIESISPDVLVKGSDWSGQIIAGYDFVLSYGGQVKFVKIRDGLSTTQIEEKIRGSNKL